MIKIKSVSYCTPKDETTIFFIKSVYGKGKESLITFKGKIEKKRENPTEDEVLKFIELKGGIK